MHETHPYVCAANTNKPVNQNKYVTIKMLNKKNLHKRRRFLVAGFMSVYQSLH